VTILLELVAKHLLGKTAYAFLLKIRLAKYCLPTDRAFLKTLHQGCSREAMLGRRHLSSRRFFVDSIDDQVVWQEYQQRFAHKWPTIVAAAESLCQHRFDLLGTGPCSWGEPIDWHLDPHSGYRWPKKFYAELTPVSSLHDTADVKLPYELSRLQHLPTLGKAYRITHNERYAQEIVAHITHWLEDNPCLIGVNWTCAMEVAIRIVNILWGLAFIEDASCYTMAFRQRVLTAVWEHGQYVISHLEYSIHRDGTIGNHNHFLSDIVGLVYLGVLFPEFRAAQQWRQLGVTALSEEMARQVYPDGADYESSLTYHRFVLELFTSAALLCRLNGISLPESFWTKLEKMFEFTLYMTRPDGKMPQVGDADDGRLHILSDYGHWDRTDHRYLCAIGAILFHRTDMKAAAGAFSEEAFWLFGGEGAKTFDALPEAQRPLESKAFPASGFYSMRAGKTYLLACCNAVGTAAAGNHKHNDLLSFELYTADTAFIVDPGAYIYTAAPTWRNRFRSTHYHNTVVVDAQEQNRFVQNKLFRLMPDAEPIVHAWRSTAECDWLEAEHTGYHRLPQPVTHRRAFRFEKRLEKLHITDVLQGRGEHRAEWYFHFDHGIAVERLEDVTFVARARGAKLFLRIVGECPVTPAILDGWVSRQYGIKFPAKILTLSTLFTNECRMVFEASCQ
jgi:hypothetical protein